MNQGETPQEVVPVQPAVTEVAAVASGRKLFTPSSHTDWATVEGRQEEVDGILAASEDPLQRVKELNQRFSKKWDDETGANFLHILGEQLPGLEIHGRAVGLVVVGSELEGLNIESADLEASVWSLSSIEDIRARGANINMSIWPLTRISGDMSDMDAVDANFNLARLNVRAQRARFAASFMIGTQGLNTRNSREADFRQVTVLPASQSGERRRLSPTDIMRRANSRRFIDARTGDLDLELVQAVVHRDFNARNALEAGRVAEGQVWVNGSLQGARLAEFELTGSILDNVALDRANARMLRAAGVITRLSSFGSMVAPGSWFPGSVHFRPNLTRADISEGNWPGSVIIDPLLTGITAQETNLDGSLVISDQPQSALEDQAKGRLRVVEMGQLAPSVQAIITEAQLGLAARARKTRELPEVTRSE